MFIEIIPPLSGKLEDKNKYYDKAIKLNPHFLHAYYAKYSINQDYHVWSIADATYSEMKLNNPDSEILYYDDDIYINYSYKNDSCYMELIKEIKEYEKSGS